MNREDWTLLVLAAAEGEFLTPAQLQKSVFLLGAEQADTVGTDFYEFIPYAFGPYCAAVYYDAEELERQGFAEIYLSRTGRWREYRATPNGRNRARELGTEVPEVVRFVSAKVNWARQQTFQSLIREIYRMYPEYRVNSIFQD